MKKNVLLSLSILLGIGLFLFYGNASGLFSARLQAPAQTPQVKAVPENWATYQAQARAEKQAYLAKHRVDFDHFANFAVSETDGIPLIILKLLPVVAPEYWGDKNNFLSVMGLFNDERLHGYPFPRGIGFSGLSRKGRFADIDYASFTCGGCHIGRVRKEDNTFEYLDGGVNSEFDVIGYRMRIVQTLNKIVGDAKTQKQKYQNVIDALLTALDKTHQQDPNYFYNNYVHDYQNHYQVARRFDADYEAKQIALFKKNAASTITTFVDHQEQAYEGWRIISEKYYPEISDRIVKGFPGMEDAIGFNAVKGYLGLREKNYTKPFAHLALPRAPGITDIMVVWDQDSRNPRWNADKTNLVDGGGQWNGHIPLPMFKNIAAQITLGFDNVDITVSAHADKLLDKLPASVYPFDVDISLAKKGQKLFARNCASCHQPNNGKVYRNIGTHMGRAKIAGTIITVGAQAGFTADAVCSPTTTVDMYGKPAQPCAVYRGESMVGKNKYAMTPPRVHNGYNALPLTGLWAQAPYLHTGSVPTLYHLLIPNERPDQFIKSRLDYDTNMVGFRWQIDGFDDDSEEGYLYDTASSAIIGHQGHDRDITQDGITYKLNWQDDKPGAMALIEYLKTL